MKSVLKEIIIILLLCVAIALILVVLFYSYIPTNKIIPSNIEAYTTESSIKDEINQEIVEYPKQNITLEITDSDLTIYKQSQSYNPGKANPFGTENTQSSGTNINSNSTQNTSQNSVVSNTNSSDTFFEDTKLK